MKLSGKEVLVTGGAGFIGSHLVDALVGIDCKVTVYDNFTSGRMEFLNGAKDRISIIEDDTLNPEGLQRAVSGKDAVFHLAANPDVRVGVDDTRVHIDQNVIATYNLLEAMRKEGVTHIGFTSTSTVYGEASIIPTPEDYGPLLPISLYGASKMACEALISAYTGSFGMQAVLYRFANTVGPRSTHGVTFDFINKLKANPGTLEILGVPPGTQKSYFHIEDCVSGMIMAFESLGEEQAMPVNIGSEDTMDVKEIADVVCSEMGLEDTQYSWTGGVDGGRGWIGDVKVMRLGIEKLKSLGWNPKYTSADAIRHTARHLIQG